MRDTNREQLIAAAALLRPLLGELVFVGGCVTGLLITDEAAGAPRSTLDVDAIVEIASYAEYAEFGEGLRKLGFQPDTREGAPLCRWIHGRTVLDVMPLDEKILGFTNRWYRHAIQSAVVRKLAPDLEIRAATAPVFVATKIEAFRGRGKRDFFGSHDLEDIIAVVDGRESLTKEVRAESEDLRGYIRRELNALLANSAFLDALPGFLLPDSASQARIAVVLTRLRELAAPTDRRRS